MTRGDVVTVALTGDYGKPRPAIVIQHTAITHIESILICPFTSHAGMQAAFRPCVVPDVGNGLRQQSFAMTDKIAAVPRVKCGPVIGRLTPTDMAAVDESLTFVLGLGD